MSRCKDLVSWIAQLNFTCGSPCELSQSYPSNPLIKTPHGRQLMHQLQKQIETEDQDDHAGVWPTVEMVHATSPKLPSYTSRCRSLEDSLARQLRGFKNLASASFSYTWNDLPARYRQILESNNEEKYDYASDGYIDVARSMHAHVGLQILLSSLSASNILLKSLGLAVELIDSIVSQPMKRWKERPYGMSAHVPTYVASEYEGRTEMRCSAR